MTMNFVEAMAEAEVEDAFDRAGVDAGFRAAALADCPSAWLPILARKVVILAMMRDRDHPEVNDRFPVEGGADDYVKHLLVVRESGIPEVPGDDFDWHGALAWSCDAIDLSPGDRAYVLAELARQGWRSVALWARASVTSIPIAPRVLARLGCRHFAMACLWLRDHRPDSLPLSFYAAAG